MIAGSQTIADDRRRSQTIAEDRTWFYLLRSSAIVCDHDRRIAGDRRSVFPYDRRRSQNFLRSAIRDPRSSAIIWKPAFKENFPVLNYFVGPVEPEISPILFAPVFSQQINTALSDRMQQQNVRHDFVLKKKN